ncbi:Gfo/Idh/MocA family protein [Singulisphaera rosea]
MTPKGPGFSRRDFVRGVVGTGLLSGFPTIIPSSAFGANEAIRVGHIGVKNRGMQNLKPLLKHTVAICDVDKDVLASAKGVVEKAGRPCKTYSDYRQLLDDKDIDAVVVSTPDHWHALITVDACASGKDVYCEKPLSLTIDEGKAMVAAARKHNRVPTSLSSV